LNLWTIKNDGFFLVIVTIALSCTVCKLFDVE